MVLPPTASPLSTQWAAVAREGVHTLLAWITSGRVLPFSLNLGFNRSCTAEAILTTVLAITNLLSAGTQTSVPDKDSSTGPAQMPCLLRSRAPGRLSPQSLWPPPAPGLGCNGRSKRSKFREVVTSQTPELGPEVLLGDLPDRAWPQRAWNRRAAQQRARTFLNPSYGTLCTSVTLWIFTSGTTRRYAEGV